MEHSPNNHGVRLLYKTKQELALALVLPQARLFDEMVSILGERDFKRLRYFAQRWSARMEQEIYDTNGGMRYSSEESGDDATVDVYRVFQRVAYVLEYCRHAHIESLRLFDDPSMRANDELSESITEVVEGRTKTENKKMNQINIIRRVKLDLKSFIQQGKACCRPKTEFSTICPQMGIISCSRCLIACWCSETCVGASFEEHQLTCNLAFQYRTELGL